MEKKTRKPKRIKITTLITRTSEIDRGIGPANLAPIPFTKLLERYGDRKPRVEIKGDWIQFIGERYGFPLSRIESPIHLVQWITHLNKKTWFSRQVLNEFCAKVCAAKGWPAHSQD